MASIQPIFGDDLIQSIDARRHNVTERNWIKFMYCTFLVFFRGFIFTSSEISVWYKLFSIPYKITWNFTLNVIVKYLLWSYQTLLVFKHLLLVTGCAGGP